MKIYTILFSLLLFSSILQGQNCYNKCLNRKLIDSTKAEIYKSILLSKEIKNQNESYLINIETFDLDIDLNKIFFLDNVFFYDRIKEQKDSITVKKLIKIFPDNYKIYEELNERKYIEYDQRRKMLQESFSKYNDWNDSNYMYVKIYKPLTNWINLYFYLSSVAEGKPYEIIPVMYSSIKNNEEIERKYMLYEVRFTKEGEIKSVKVVN
ncbi:hypothetical protein [Apibacter sp. HY039]|uniref:hypothetical protein n=1 Tax=Apibacter sp. HY039 TaxID=2501476 RepID=UPI000FEBCD45|nr:hypothetical protein [Apibacter sp. HY039]